MKKILSALLIVAIFVLPGAAYSLPAYFVDSDWLSEHIDDENLIVLEVRYHPHRYYTVGHIPGAVSVVILEGTASQTWVDDDQLAELYKDIPLDKTIYVYCHDGFRMSLAYMQLKYLDAKDVRLYNGGWSHWGDRLSLPTVYGDKPSSGDYDL